MNKLDQSVDIGPYDDGFYYFDIETVPLPGAEQYPEP
jgi:hypothetical protein